MSKCCSCGSAAPSKQDVTELWKSRLLSVITPAPLLTWTEETAQILKWEFRWQEGLLTLSTLLWNLRAGSGPNPPRLDTEISGLILSFVICVGRWFHPNCKHFYPSRADVTALAGCVRVDLCVVWHRLGRPQINRDFICVIVGFAVSHDFSNSASYRNSIIWIFKE